MSYWIAEAILHRELQEVQPPGAVDPQGFEAGDVETIVDALQVDYVVIESRMVHRPTSVGKRYLQSIYLKFANVKHPAQPVLNEEQIANDIYQVCEKALPGTRLPHRIDVCREEGTSYAYTGDVDP